MVALAFSLSVRSFLLGFTLDDYRPARGSRKADESKEFSDDCEHAQKIVRGKLDRRDPIDTARSSQLKGSFTNVLGGAWRAKVAEE